MIMDKEKIVYKKIEELHLNERNPRKNDEAVATVAKSIEKYGFRNPLIVDSNGKIYCGNTRFKAAKKLGLTECPCIVADDLTEQQIREYALIDNKSAEQSDWDFDLLSEELADLDLDDFGLDWGLPEDEEEKEIIEDTPPEVDEQAEPICKTGDIWQLGEHRLICGDSTDRATIERLMGDDFGKVDLLLTDPPYNVAYEGKTEDKLKIENDEMSQQEFTDFLVSAFEVAKESLREGGGFYIWHASRSQREFENSLNEVGLQVRQQLIWVKNSMVLGRQDYQWRHEPCFYGWKDGAHSWCGDRKQTTVLEFDRPTANKEHPTMKPIALMAYQIGNSTKKGDIVFDGFGGSGSTLIACEQLGRKCYTAELDPRYADVIIKRYENLTGNKAVKINV